MRIKINGEDVDRNVKISVNTREGSTFAAWCVIIIGGLLAYGWYVLWL